MSLGFPLLVELPSCPYFTESKRELKYLLTVHIEYLITGKDDSLGSHTRAFKFLGGVPEIIVPDNLKTGVNKSCRYEPDLNPTYQDMASHYRCVVIPTRIKSPKDKAKVETGVKTVEQWILARLRNITFSVWPILTKPSEACCKTLTPDPFKRCPGQEGQCLRNWTDPL